MIERTFAMIKPDAVQAKNTGKILDLIEQNGFEIIRMEKGLIPTEMAQEFYAVHKEKPFYSGLVEFVSSGPIIAMVLEKENGIKAWRDLMGATNPANAAPGTIRKLFAASIDHNAVHGSDAPETAMAEIALFFPEELDEEGLEEEICCEEDECAC